MGAGSHTGADARRSGNRARLGLLSSLAVVAVIAVPATVLAAKGGGTSAPAWIALASVSGQSVAAAQPQLGSAVRFATGYASTTKNPWVSVTCYQGGTLVYGEGGKPSADFTLGGASSRWLDTGGAASCRAELGDLYWRGGKQHYTYMAHTNFDAGG